MTDGLQIQSQARGTPHADLGFWMQSQIIGQPMAMTAHHLTHLIETITANRFVLPRDRKSRARITDKGTAIVEVHGVLLNRIPVLGSFWGLTSYEGLTEQCRRLSTNTDVKRVVLDINSPGGVVMGIQGCSDALCKLGEKKPVHAIAHDMADSAGYWLAACARTISVTKDGEVGSIGVRSGHISYAEMLERSGMEVTLFSAGATKNDRMPYQILQPQEAAEEAHGVERDYDRFVAHVAKHRRLSEDAVRETDARVFRGSERRRRQARRPYRNAR